MRKRAAYCAVAACLVAAVALVVYATLEMKSRRGAGGPVPSDGRPSGGGTAGGSELTSVARRPDALETAGEGLEELDPLCLVFDEALDYELKTATSVARESTKFAASKAAFWEKATDEQKAEGKEVLRNMRSAMDLPGDAGIRAKVTTKEGPKRDFDATIMFKYPCYYREEGKGDVSYTYITDGEREITDFATAERDLLPAPVGRDVDADKYFDMFPVRLAVDSEMAWSERKQVVSSAGQPVDVDVLSGWSYDVMVRRGDSLVEQVVFYDRKSRSMERIRISDIVYGSFETGKAATGGQARSMLPTAYTMTYQIDGEVYAYAVTLDYEFGMDFAVEQFELSVDR